MRRGEVTYMVVRRGGESTEAKCLSTRKGEGDGVWGRVGMTEIEIEGGVRGIKVWARGGEKKKKQAEKNDYGE
jgi:hypothetical protein